MRHIDDDMDELYKRAGDNYPLNTNSRDWESLQRRLFNVEEREILTDKRAVTTRKLSLLVLLLLVPAGLMITQYFINVKQENYVQLPFNNKNRNTINKENENKGTAEVFSTSENKLNKPSKVSEIFSDNKVPIANEDIKIDEVSVCETLYFSAFDNEIVRSSVDEHILLNNKTEQKELNKETSLTINNGSDKKERKIAKAIAINKPKRFYISAVLAPELTSVKFQSVKKVSFNLGGIIGYRINDRFNIEAGITLAHRYFYSDGKYIEHNSITSDNSDILNVRAFSIATEIPLSLRYNIKQSEKGKWFASVGGVSYVIHKEQYAYNYTKDGEVNKGIKYNNKASDYWFSNVQLSVGYEVAGKLCDIRIEPYYRIPLHGIGISKLPVTSAGLNIALTKSIK